MKICILSMQRVNNFGSLLQSYALKTMLRQMGHQVAFLDIVPNQEDNALLEGSVEDFSKECDAGKGILTKLKKLDRYAINRLRIKLADRRQLQKFQQFRQNVLEIADNTAKLDFNSEFGVSLEHARANEYAASATSSVFSLT